MLLIIQVNNTPFLRQAKFDFFLFIVFICNKKTIWQFL